MSTRTRKRVKEQLFEEDHDELDLEALSSEELEDLLFDEPEEKKNGIWNLPTIAGLSLILVGAGLILERLGFMDVPLSSFTIDMLPWLASILIMLLGFGVLSWRPKKKRIKKIKVDLKTQKPKVKIEKENTSTYSRRLKRSRDKKIAGVAGGIADYFNIDPTLVRIAFVVGAILTLPNFAPVIIAYFILSKIIPGHDSASEKTEERITIIKDN